MIKSPRVCLLDIETSPIQGYTWTTWDASVLKILEPSKVISIAWKWLGEDETFCRTLIDYKGYKPGVINDEKLIKEAWDLLDQSDVVIGHHSDAFDLKKLNARFVYYSLGSPSPYKSVDTKKAASKYFRLDSNSLNNIGVYLNLGQKVENGGFSLWDRCINGDKEAWELMRRYNIQDVVLLEKVYLALRPFIQNHPHLGLLAGNEDTESCPSCQSPEVSRRGFSITRTGKRQRYQCKSCGAWSQGKFEKVKSSNILFSEET